MALEPVQEKLLRCFYPGLVEALKDLGPGEFSSFKPTFKTYGADGIREAEFRVTYTIAADGRNVDLRFRERRRLGPAEVPTPIHATDVVDLSKWERYYYSLHYGQPVNDPIFRVDLDAERGHHVHFKNSTEHVPSMHVDPDPTNMDPRDFVALVKKYRIDRSYPFRRTKK